MPSYPLYMHFIFGLFSTIGFCILFHVPKKHIVLASLAGAVGWLTYQYLMLTGMGSVFSCFWGACAVALVAEICSKAGREATTLFIIPGILPLVPGAGMYNTMLLFLEKDLQEAASVGTEALTMAGGIALALLLVASIARLFNSLALNLIIFIKGVPKREIH